MRFEEETSSMLYTDFSLAEGLTQIGGRKSYFLATGLVQLFPVHSPVSRRAASRFLFYKDYPRLSGLSPWETPWPASHPCHRAESLGIGTVMAIAWCKVSVLH